MFCKYVFVLNLQKSYAFVVWRFFAFFKDIWIVVRVNNISHFLGGLDALPYSKCVNDRSYKKNIYRNLHLCFSDVHDTLFIELNKWDTLSRLREIIAYESFEKRQSISNDGQCFKQKSVWHVHRFVASIKVILNIHIFLQLPSKSR